MQNSYVPNDAWLIKQRVNIVPSSTLEPLDIIKSSHTSIADMNRRLLITVQATVFQSSAPSILQ